jgi:type IV pilus assembly protein PilY1
MNRGRCKTHARWAAAVATALAALYARADLDEAWLHRAELPPDLTPLLAVVLDRSSATGQSVTVGESYDPVIDYGAGLTSELRCDSARTYWRRGPGPAPDCRHQAGLDTLPSNAETGLHCDAARAALAASGFFVASRAAQWRSDPVGGFWHALHADRPDAVECRADRGRHGATTGAWYASDGMGTAWTVDVTQEIAWDRPPFADAYVFYAGNFLNYLRTALASVERPMADVMAEHMAQALAATDGLEVALVLVDDDGPDGGFIARAPVASRVAAEEVRALAVTSPAGSAPLAETLVETASWLQGGPLIFGADVRADAAASDASGRYRSPFEHACRPVSLGFLTAGLASDDEQAPAAADALAGFAAETGGCGDDCLATVAAWLASTDLRDDLAGAQSTPVAWIAPASGAAAAGRIASPADPLSYANLIASAFQHDAAVPAPPQLSTAALTQDAGGTPGVILGLVAPRARTRWPGNLLRYGLRAPDSPFEAPILVDLDGEPAIETASGLPFPDSRSFWSEAPDANLLAGGAAGRLPPADARRIATDVAGSRLLDAGNALAPGNARLGRVALGLGPTDSDSVEEVLGWAASQRSLGDPGLHAPVVVDDAASGRTLVFAATQDGLLHAFDAESGVEQWAWMPQQLLPRLPGLLRDEVTTARSHGIDGALVLHRHDADGDGQFSAAGGEHQWLLFGLGRGGSRYHALDIAEPLDPRVLWSVSLPEPTVEARAVPVVARLEIAGSDQSAGRWVVLLAGGYDRRFDSQAAEGPGLGNALLVLDADTGELLWSAGGADAELAVPGLASVAAAPRALDLDGDGYLDRAYVLDVTGSLWRFDFSSGMSSAELATASRLARFGAGNLRFHSTPDVSLSRTAGVARLAVAAGSGWLSRPRDLTRSDRFYVVFDDPAGPAAAEVSDDEFHDATDAADAMPADAPGWYFRLDAHGPGEKVAGSAVTFNHLLRFQTYQPLADDGSEPCGPPRSVSRRYTLAVRTALPRASAVESEADEPDEVAASGLPPALRFGFPGRWDGSCDGCRPRPFGIVGGQTFDPGYAGDPVRTSWRKLAPPPASP